MNDIDCSYDDLLCRSLSLFRQFRLYDDRIEEDNAFVFLRVGILFILSLSRNPVDDSIENNILHSYFYYYLI